MSRRWAPAEDAYLRRTYGRYPIRTLTRKLKRTTSAVRNRAQRIGIQDRHPPGYSPLAWAHTRPCGNHWGASHAIIKAAKRAGVLRQANHVRGRPYIAPTTWIEQWLEDRHTAPVDATTEHVMQYWIRTRDLAEMLGIRASHAASKLIHMRGRLRKLAKHARRTQIKGLPGQPLYWHPTDAKRLAHEWRTQCQNPTHATSPALTPSPSSASTTPSPPKPATLATRRAKARTWSQPACNASNAAD
jgi:hypothetical protein